ncbi:MAG: hypothetical protein P4M11_08695, partial [Candidatus Pacebacteria bacterium]|nr:hypothetical protein [Candidatus Paceibacterota bacterium]
MTFSRASCIDLLYFQRFGRLSTLMRHDEVAPILRMFHWAYAEESPLLVYERSRLKAILASAQGVRQGDPFAAFVFALVQTLYEKAIAGHPDCHAVSVLDDLTLVGPLDQVMRAYDYIALHAEEYHLQLRVDKCSVYIPPADDLSPATRHSIEHACTSRQLRCLDRLELLGVTLGTAEDIHSHLTRSIDQHQKLFEYLHHPAMPTQIGFALLRYCALPRLSYLARTTLPEHMLRSEMAPRFDSMVIDCYHRIMGTTEEMSDRHVLEQIQLPIKRGGMGLRPVARTCHSAYFASLASIMTEFVQAFPATENYRIDYLQTKVTRELTVAREGMVRDGVSFGREHGREVSPLEEEPTTDDLHDDRTLNLTIRGLWQRARRLAAHQRTGTVVVESQAIQQRAIDEIE